MFLCEGDATDIRPRWRVVFFALLRGVDSALLDRRRRPWFRFSDRQYVLAAELLLYFVQHAVAVEHLRN